MGALLSVSSARTAAKFKRHHNQLVDCIMNDFFVHWFVIVTYQL